jgi:hypothetical protein
MASNCSWLPCGRQEDCGLERLQVASPCHGETAQDCRESHGKVCLEWVRPPRPVQKLLGVF